MAPRARVASGQARQKVWVAIPPMLWPTSTTGPPSTESTTAPRARANPSMVNTPSLGGLERPSPGRSQVTRRRSRRAWRVYHQAVEFSPQPWVSTRVGPRSGPETSTCRSEPSGAWTGWASPRSSRGSSSPAGMHSSTTERPATDQASSSRPVGRRQPGPCAWRTTPSRSRTSTPWNQLHRR